MLPIATLKLINSAIQHAKESSEEYLHLKPNGYIFMYEALKQLKQMVELEYKVMNKQLLN